MSNPLVSVIIPCYNAEKFVERAVRSIMEQTYQNLEIICINDCSKDGTGEILQKLATEDARIVYVENETNLKLPKTLNKGIALASGDYIARMDADDISFSERIEKQIKFMQDNMNVDIVGANVFTIDEHDTKLEYVSSLLLSHQNIVSKLAWKTTMLHPTVLAKKTFFTDLNGFDENIAYAEDYDMWIRGWLLGKCFANLSDVLLSYRIHSNQMSDTKFNSKNAKIVRGFLLKYFVETKNVKFLFGYLVQTKIMYYLIRKTSKLRSKLKSLG